MHINRLTAFAASLALVAGLPAALSGQAPTGERIVPTNEVLISGYGTVGYGIRTQGEHENAFTTSISPIFLFQFQDRILFEAEFEFELQEGVTETGLEYAQLDIIANDYLTFVGGKFLLPFAVFGERLHPTWINKFATSPPIYGHHVASFGAEPLLPILSDVGAMVRGAFTPGRFQVGVSVFATQGPAIEGDPTVEIPELEFPASSGDENTDKMVGGRLDVGIRPWFEVSVSGLNGDYDEDNVLDFTAWSVASEFRVRNFELRGEYIQTRQEIETVTGFPTFVRDGFYAQLTYRWREWEPVLRWTQIFDSEIDGALEDEGAWQAGIGLDYWLSSSIAVMGAYEINREDGIEIDNDRFITHIAFGF